MNLALLGKNISHSRSPEIYKKLLGNELVKFDLLDYEDLNKIPPLRQLFNSLQGLSITSPYKSIFLNQVELVECPLSVVGINCIRFNEGRFQATNTDLHAIRQLLNDWKNKLLNREIIILGDGVMSKITELVLQEMNLNYKITSRKISKNFDQQKFHDVFIINSCSREYVFTGVIGKNVIFWDYNYNFYPHQNILPLQCDEYIDGYSLLELQAKYAVKFWSSSNCSKSL